MLKKTVMDIKIMIFWSLSRIQQIHEELHYGSKDRN